MADYISDEEVFLSLKREVLHDMRDELVKSIVPDKFFAYFRSKRIFDEDDCDIIQAEKLKRKKAEQFLDILDSKGPEAFNEFCNFIYKNKTQMFLWKKIMDKLEQKKRDRIAYIPQTIDDEEKDKVATVTMMPTPTTVIIPSFPSPCILPGPPTPPDEAPSSVFTLPSLNNYTTTTTLSGNSVSQTTTPDVNYPGGTLLPPYSNEPPTTPPPPYTA